MPTIQDFIATAKHEYEGAEDRKYHLGELEPQALETEEGATFFLMPLQTGLFTGAAEMAFDDWSFYQYCKRLSPHEAKVDAAYIKACSVKLALRQLEFWRKVWQEREVMLRLLKDAAGKLTVRAALTGLYQPIDAVPVAQKLEPMLKDRQIEYAVTQRRWSITYWEEMPVGWDKRFDVGFRVLGSEVGSMSAIRMDTLLRVQLSRGTAIIPILTDGRPLARISYTGLGSTTIGKLTTASQQGLERAAKAKESLALRMQEPLKYPQDEYLDIVNLHHLPSNMKGMVLEQPARFAGIATKFDMVCLLSQLASEATGRAQQKIETSAGLYLLSGRAKLQRNRNEEGEKNDDAN
jgi:hypothetical protein